MYKIQSLSRLVLETQKSKNKFYKPIPITYYFICFRIEIVFSYCVKNQKHVIPIGVTIKKPSIVRYPYAITGCSIIVRRP